MDFLKEKDNEIIRNILDPDMFIADSFELLSIGMDISLIAGVLKQDSLVQWQLNPGRRSVQGVIFKKPTWDIDSALEWLRNNQRHFEQSYEETKKVFAKEPRNIPGVEVFATGVWNGDEFTEKDLDQMVENFNATKDHIPPYLKLGHDNEQALLKSSGLPAAGWVSKLYRKGNKLMADFRDIPEKIYELISKGAYRKVSIELFDNLQILDKKYNNLVGAIALLGAETPGVMVLSDILDRYGLKDYDKLIKAYGETQSTKIYDYDINNKKKGGIVPEINKELVDAKAQVKDLEKQLKDAEKKASQFQANAEKTSKELEDIKANLDETRKEFAKAAADLKKAEIEKQVSELAEAGLVSKAMKPFVCDLLDADKKEFKIEDKEVSRFDLIKETLKLAKASDVNLDDNSLDDKGKSQNFSEEKAEAKIKEYMDANKCDYTTAYKAIVKEFTRKPETDDE